MIKKVFILLIIAIVVGVISSILTYYIACWISPPFFKDEVDGRVHGVMPIEQVEIGFIIGILITITFFILLFKRYSKKART